MFLINPQKCMTFEAWFNLVDQLCSFSYEAGREGFLDGLPRDTFSKLHLDEPMCIIA